MRARVYLHPFPHPLLRSFPFYCHRQNLVNNSLGSKILKFYLWKRREKVITVCASEVVEEHNTEKNRSESPLSSYHKLRCVPRINNNGLIKKCRAKVYMQGKHFRRWRLQLYVPIMSLWNDTFLPLTHWCERTRTYQSKPYGMKELWFETTTLIRALTR